MSPCILADMYWRFRVTCSDEAGSRFLWKVGTCLPDFKVSYSSTCIHMLHVSWIQNLVKMTLGCGASRRPKMWNTKILLVYIHAYLFTYIHAIFYIHKCVIETVGCGTSRKYTNIPNFYGVKYYKHVTKHYYRSSSHINIHLQSKRNVYWIVLFYVLFVSVVLFYVLFVCKCVLYYCQRVATQLQLNISYI